MLQKQPVGEITGFLGLAEDITARRNAEERFRAKVEAAPTAMLLVNVAGVIVLVNRQLRAFAELVKDEIPGQISDVRRTLDTCDSKLLRRSAYSLKGSVSYFNAGQLIQAALALEIRGREESFDDTAVQFAVLEYEVARFLAALKTGPPDSIF